ncbi:DUF2497 domain-containing protein [Aurantiacibacter sp. MUD11]|uniref:DUF2497 domain-containing protein n=1 Tax=Aurantiacibacter sp. MUD11 TaxID=3003265 RepID=UPI0022AA2769|nr:DUF2497 domain-containing protein [Aurantiacibacter sp. MUD11]WAT17176.1 DUF2497 domain-containing protein [Aurantiacibacter sp. MUD11]
MRQEGEPSVEEILESIKKVIARDAQEAQVASAPRKRAGLVAQEENEPEDVLDLGVIGSAIGDDDPSEELIEEDATDEESPDESLTTDRAAEAMRQSLAALAMLAEPPAKPQIVRQGETSLEGMVREMLRPMLAQWLDANLPDMVERLVKAEIARIAGKKR